ncbi:RNA methyltransferase, RsmD family [Desulfitobacterium dichloroeliminans LMG P-21439]|uniref:RNA methyltransferase, RsmD family n=1 Tax=Desulfitobacterium dichloroeliminans (strain LMG P-21439 / DCA1) TaxID=871963 RepID=L0FA97_DESDL|nr:16S rRNA (guanine(966)-N(2))-methyltransferase RsmD [Desulfitobacterium dichloroeliminans]AGA70132.1 RNA methyltransferase, RsmD family [Desulfitobacterium dichloroeliminans LMG P-21439]
MRIIAGDYRGQRLKAVPGINTRPTADKIKGAIFNVLREKVVDAKVLDMFSGTGNLALEALSRGAKEAILIEKSRIAQRVIQENLEHLGVQNAKLMEMDAFDYLARHQEEIFDLIFIDPPYHLGLAEKSLKYLLDPCRLTYSGVIIVETAKDENLTNVAPFEIRKTGEYGDTKIWYLQRID